MALWPLLLLLLPACGVTSHCLNWEELDVAIKKCPAKSSSICVRSHPMKIFKKTKRYIVTHKNWPGGWEGFLILEDPQGLKKALYRYHASPLGCPDPGRDVYRQELLDAVNLMIQREAITLSDVDGVDFVNDIMTCLFASRIYSEPDATGSLWKKYPGVFIQERKPVDMKPTTEGHVFTYITYEYSDSTATIWSLYTKKSGEIISIDFKNITGIPID
jgi:hypothetical protein